jgi:hypothetical protein
MFKSQLGVSSEVVGYLQKIMLNAVIGRSNLPGGDKPVMLPDMEFLLHQFTIIVADENLADPIGIKKSQNHFNILSQDAIQKEASGKIDITFLRFQPPKRVNNSIQLTLELKMAPHDPNQHVLGLSGLSVKFQEIDGKWEIVDEPLFFAI